MCAGEMPPKAQNEVSLHTCRRKGRDMRREYQIYAVERGSAAQMSVKKVRHAQGECLSERVTWFACALVKEKVEMCADEMPPRA